MFEILWLYYGHLYMYMSINCFETSHTDVFPDFDGRARSNAYQQII